MTIILRATSMLSNTLRDYRSQDSIRTAVYI